MPFAFPAQAQAGVKSRRDKSMPDQTPTPPSPATPPPPTAPKEPTINIGEEYGTAKKNLPPVKIVLIAVGAVLLVVLVASFLKRAKPQGGGSLDNVGAVDEVQAQGLRPIGATVALPGLVDIQHGALLVAPNLHWRDVPVVELLR